MHVDGVIERKLELLQPCCRGLHLRQGPSPCALDKSKRQARDSYRPTRPCRKLRPVNSPAQPQQLDIFADTRDLVLRNDVLAALAQCDGHLAQRRCGVLAVEYPQDADLPALRLLINALLQPATATLTQHAELALARLQLSQQLAPAARQAMGADAAERWLLPLWCALATRGATLPYEPAHTQDHAAPLWLLGQNWAAAAHAVAGVESWRRIPAPLMWMAQARYRLDGLDACWPLLAELAWLSAARLKTLLADINDPLLQRLQKRFHASFEGHGDDADLAWFPAWALTETPALAPHLALAQAGQHEPAERGARALLELLSLERQGRHHDVVQRRRALRDLHAGLYAAYMATR
jgi:hypothetical protein